MNVCFLSHHCCIRVVKEGVALLKAGVGVHFLQNNVANKSSFYLLPMNSYYDSKDQLAAHLQCLSGLDLIHVHNTPDWLVSVAKAARPDLPIVYDVHDMDSVRYTSDPGVEEKEAFSMADGYVYPSISYRNIAAEKHSEAVAGKPSAVIYSMVNEDIIHYDSPLTRVSGIVYEGGVSHPSSDEYSSWLDYSFIVQAAREQGFLFSIYSDGKFRNEYMGLGAIYHTPVDYHILTPQLSRYDWGLVGNGPCSHPQQEAAMPNKLWEYLAAGIPVMTINAKEAGEFVEKHGLGVALTDLKQIPSVYYQYAAFRNEVLCKRHLFTMESQTNPLLNLYREVIDGRQSQ